MEKKFRKRKSKYSEETIFEARYLYLKKHSPAEIAKELGLNSPRPVYYWAEKYNWRNLLNEKGVEELIALRIVALLEREKKTDQEIKELDALIERDIQYKKQRADLAKKATAYAENNDADKNVGESKKRKKNKKIKNDISHITEEMFQPFIDTLFDYQLNLRNHIDRAIRMLLKSRQIGATYYFAFEALENAIKTGDNQIFLSASKKQSEIFKTYIVKMARQYFDIELTGNPIILSNGAELHFLSTNKSTAQGYHGHVYGDEFAWLRNFEEFYTVSSAMATHKKWRETYFSTPSSKFHGAYRFWSGEMWKEGSNKRKDIVFPSFDEMRDGGRDCPDGAWRYVVTIEDALKGGAGALFDIDQLKNKYSTHAFKQLFMCVWVDDADSIFNIADVLKCAVDISKWADFDPGDSRPFGNREVWGGYDPAHSGDGSSFVIVAPPLIDKEKYRVLARYQWFGMSYQWQASQIKALMNKYNFTYLGIDANGVGYGVYEALSNYKRRIVHQVSYVPELKTAMVLKVHNLVEKKNLEWDENEKDIPASFLMIKQTATKSSGKITYMAERSITTQHADVFWAIANAIDKKELDDDKPKRKSRWH
ncbi:terminase family protein [Pasteurella skyensis]|uniref:Terminase family protein n=1 Tax=Phocoenobacter skyensis TaxID=97481 RepID=A0AAJ6P1I2_9PAST|nr:terminase family protein [Pasteurella skyensis]MDP8173670.1 terminase family protein [Pasteurella skyensis]MDP8178038.1 terminase family protein [Pasteurella skyensis]